MKKKKKKCKEGREERSFWGTMEGLTLEWRIKIVKIVTAEKIS